MRQYRWQLNKGQTSPLHLGDFAVEQILKLSNALSRPLKILDVGCGSGNMMSQVLSRLPKSAVESVTGIDWSPAAIDRLQGTSIYSSVVLCKSSTLPFKDNEFDIAISIENLEHLYRDDVVPAIVDMARIAYAIVIVTPTMADVINLQWLDSEIPQATADTDTVSELDFQALEGAVHKSTVTPASMAQAGFYVGNPNHGRYYAVSSTIVPAHIQVIGILPDYSSECLNTRYIHLLHNSRNLHSKILNEDY